MERSEDIKDLAAALVKAQGEFKAVGKSSENPFFKSKYADLASVIKSASPVLAKNGLAISQLIGITEHGESALTTLLLHSSGQFISSTMPLILTKKDPQGQGSAITYARRYSYMAAIGLVSDEDDDGHAASKQTFPEELPVVEVDTGLPPRAAGAHISKKQLDYIVNLFDGVGITAAPDRLNLTRLYSKNDDIKSAAQLTGSEASMVIERLVKTLPVQAQEDLLDYIKAKELPF